MSELQNSYGEAPHPDFATLKEKNGLEWWEWRRPEDGILQIQLTGKGVLSEAETDKLGGTFLDDTSYEILAGDESVDIYRPVVRELADEWGLRPVPKPEELLVVSLRKKALPSELTVPAHKILRHAAGTSKNRGLAAGFATAEGLGKDPSRFVSRGGATAGYLTEDGYLSRTSESNQVLSGIVGHFNATPRNPYCRQTSFTRDRFDEFMSAMPFIEAINAQFRQCIRGRWEKQNEFCRQARLGEKGWMLGSTVFSTITVNKNYRTGVHKDAGDFEQGFGNLTVLEGGEHKYKGGRTVFPRYRIAVDLRTGDFLGMDVHEWHGNTLLSSVEEGKDDWERISVVCYVRVKMEQCGSVEEETEKFERWKNTTFKNPSQRHDDLIRTTEDQKKRREEDLGTLAFLLDPNHASLPTEEKVSLPVVEEDRDEDDLKCRHGREYNPRAKDCHECEAARVGCFEPKPPSGIRPRAVWVVGDPGAGKTTLVRAIIEGNELALIRSPKWTVAGDYALAGHYTGAAFDGADTVNYNGVDEALTYWETSLQEKRVVFFDGDRFSHEKAKVRVAEKADPLVIHLSISEQAASERRKERGSAQNEAWVRGRRTKSAKFASTFEENQRLVLDASRPVSELAKDVRAWLAGEPVASFTPREGNEEALADLSEMFG